ncbi:MAG: hypothetical protein V3W41_14450 [Planctomycetota bacterium]
MAAPLPFLIDKTDSFEIVRDQIVSILDVTQADQVAKATTAGKPDPSEWKLRVFAERSNPWEQFLNAASDAVPDQSPIVNVWYDTGAFDKSVGDVVKTQQHAAVYNIDVYGWGIAADVAGPGHSPGDESAALVLQRGIKFVRNILMSSVNTYLQLRPKPESDGDPRVWQRWIQSITSFQVQLGDDSAHQVNGGRIALAVTFNEFSPQGDESNPLEQLGVDINLPDSGTPDPAVEVEFDYT